MPRVMMNMTSRWRFSFLKIQCTQFCNLGIESAPGPISNYYNVLGLFIYYLLI